jgi:hypothetical protein
MNRLERTFLEVLEAVAASEKLGCEVYEDDGLIHFSSQFETEADYQILKLFLFMFPDCAIAELAYPKPDSRTVGSIIRLVYKTSEQ